MERANEIMGFPRHLSQHVGGFVITRDRLDEIVPIVKTAMDQRKMVEWDKDDLDSVKILKVDVLALGMLTCLQRAFTLLTEHYPKARDPYGQPYVLATLPPEDRQVYKMICRADTLGVFQIESRAQMSMLPRLKPEIFTISSSRWRSCGRARSRATWSIPICAAGKARNRPSIKSRSWRRSSARRLAYRCSRNRR
jgi:error-prone DNA polymerase